MGAEILGSKPYGAGAVVMGMAIGVSFAQGDMTVGLPLTTVIALQDIPEGLAATLGFMGGFALMMVLDTALG